MGVDSDQFICEELNCCEWVTEDEGIEFGESVVAVDVAICPLAEGPVKFLMWDLFLFVSSVLFAVLVVAWAVFLGTIDPMEFGM
jgi:hypothetical protein